MEITNARIKNVTVGFDEWEKFSVKMELYSQHDKLDWYFILTDPTDVQRLMRLMNYTGSHEIGDLNNKIVRKVISEKIFRGIGDPIEDRFFLTLTEEFKEINESEFEELLKSE